MSYGNEVAPNPYQSPSTLSELPLPTAEGAPPLASRVNRLGAAILDGLIGLALLLPVSYLSGYMTPTAEPATVGQVLLMTAYGIAVFFLVHGYLLVHRGQTVGKKLAKIQIVDSRSNQILPLGKLVGLRYVPIWIVSMIPFGNVLVIIDALFIFGKDRRCVHDYLAGTKVVDVTQ